MKRVKCLCDFAAKRKANIFRLLNMCIDNTKGELTKEQKAAALTLRRIGEAPYVPDMQFYEHIVAEREAKNRKQ